MPTSCCLCAGCAVVKLSTVPYGEFMHKCINIVEPIANRGVEGFGCAFRKSHFYFSHSIDSLLFFLLLLRKRFYVKFKSRLRKSSEWISGKFFFFWIFLIFRAGMRCHFYVKVASHFYVRRYFYVGTFT